MKAIIGVVTGISVFQSVITPVIDTVKTSTLQKSYFQQHHTALPYLIGTRRDPLVTDHAHDGSRQLQTAGRQQYQVEQIRQQLLTSQIRAQAGEWDIQLEKQQDSQAATSFPERPRIPPYR